MLRARPPRAPNLANSLSVSHTLPHSLTHSPRQDAAVALRFHLLRERCPSMTPHRLINQARRETGNSTHYMRGGRRRGGGPSCSSLTALCSRPTRLSPLPSTPPSTHTQAWYGIFSCAAGWWCPSGYCGAPTPLSSKASEGRRRRKEEEEGGMKERGPASPSPYLSHLPPILSVGCLPATCWRPTPILFSRSFSAAVRGQGHPRGSLEGAPSPRLRPGASLPEPALVRRCARVRVVCGEVC